jgi:hypothetical protein
MQSMGSASAVRQRTYHFHAQAPEPDDQNVARGHAPHAFLAVDGQLARVQILVKMNGRRAG